MFILFFLLLSITGFAADPVVTNTNLEAAREAYRSSLAVRNNGSGDIWHSMVQCAKVRDRFLEAMASLNEVDAEIAAVSSAEALHAEDGARQTYLDALAEERGRLEALVEEALGAAKVASAARAKALAEQRAASPTTTAWAHGPHPAVDPDPSAEATVPTLPAEFDGCFPKPVAR